MRIRVSPTRMQLLRLRRRLALARRGHKLLKDKLDGLVQQFLTAKNSYLELHDRLEPEIKKLFLQAALGAALSEPAALEPSPDQPRRQVETSSKNIMGVRVPAYQLLPAKAPQVNELLGSVELIEALKNFNTLLPELVQLASQGQALRLLASQIIETRRRVNALEYVLIPELQRTANLIRMKLAEQERSTRVVLLKISK